MKSWLKNMFYRDNSGAIILMYHRIAETAIDPWDLCVTPENFDSQISELKKEFTFISTFRLAERLQTGEPLSDFAAITFDDGYLDNYTHALPILKKHETRASFYITTKFLHEKKFWWDELEQIMLVTPTLPEILKFDINGKAFNIIIGESSVLTPAISEQNMKWRYGQPYGNNRLKVFFELWSELKFLPIDAQKAALEKIKNWSGTHIIQTPPLMNEHQIKDIGNNGLFELGAHTVNHPALGALSRDDQYAEITGSKKVLEDIVSKNLAGLAYPYGHFNQYTPAVTKKCGFHYALTTEPKRLGKEASLFTLPRFQVRNVDGKTLLKNIKTL
jgi:peptidoglycan/xylan/chitin deacetylase (PgdA/CDA1 family)